MAETDDVLRSIYSERAEPRVIKIVSMSESFAMITHDGRVLIDWAATEQAADYAPDPMLRAVARLMLAVRTGDWEKLP